MACDESLILSTLKARLQTITVGNGYPLTVKTVELNKGAITIDVASTKLPYIEIINGEDKILERFVGGLYRGGLDMTFRIVLNKASLDTDMADFKSAVLRCLFGNSYDPSSSSASACRLNDGTRDLLTMMEYNTTFTDINLINSNRVWDVNLTLIYNRKITAF